MATNADYAIPARATTDGISPVGERGDKDRNPSASALEEAAQPIINELMDMAATAVQRRQHTEQRWLRNLRQFHGKYEGAIANALEGDDSRSKVFINVTRTKTNSWIARIGDMLFPNDEKNFGIEPTPLPNLTDDARRAVQEAERLDEEAQLALEQHNAALDAGQEPDPMHAMSAVEAGSKAARLRQNYDQSQKVLEEARERARRMERTIDDKLTEAKYPNQARKVITDACKLGSGVMKGPILGGKQRRTWKLLDDGKGEEGESKGGKLGKSASIWELSEADDDAPMYRRVDTWHFFPDPDAETLAEAQYVLERHLPNRKMLKRLARQQGFDKRAVRRLLESGPRHSQATSSGFSHLQELRAMEDDQSSVADTPSLMKDRYTVWEFYGSLEVEQIATIMRGMGNLEKASNFEENADPLDEHMVRIFFCDGVLLKIEENYLLDSQEFIYSVFSFEEAEASILGGVGVPELMDDEQSMLNSAVRMMMDNSALAVAPQVVTDKEAVVPENGDWRMTPRKVWNWVKGKNAPNKEAPFVTIDIPINQEQLSAIIMLAIRFIDEAVAMPLIAQGEQGQHITKTSSGMSMLFNSANVVFRRVIKSYDDSITTPVVRRTYDFLMQFSDDDSIKGDMQVEARGTSVLLVREMQAEQLIMIIERFSTHPVIGVGIKAYEAMRLVLQAMNINPGDVLLEREEYLEKLKAMSEQDDGAGSDDAIKLQIAQIDQETRLAQSASNERVAQMRMQTELMQLAQTREIKVEEIAAMFRSKEIDASVKMMIEQGKLQSSERKQAAEIAVERQNAREARAQGMNATGSGGSISLGREKA